MRLRPGTPVLYRRPDEVQIGADPRWAVVLTGLPPGAARALHALPGSSALVRVESALRAEGCDERDVSAVVGHLRAAHVLTDDDVPARPDALAWDLVDGRADRWSRRASATVRVVGLGRLGMVTAASLVCGGVGHVQLQDARAVGQADLGVSGYAAGDLGRARTAAAVRVLRERAPGALLTPVPDDPQSRGRTPAARRAPDVVVLVEHGASDPVARRVWERDDVAHLSLVVREASVQVGPFVVPGRSACLRCLDLHRADLDPQWPVLATQLAFGRRGGNEEATLVGVAGSLGAAQVLAHLDGLGVAADGAVLDVALPDLTPRRQEWPVHPGCGCTGLV